MIRLQASQSAILLRWTATLERKQGLLPGALDHLSDRQIARAIAQLQFASVTEAASSAYHRPRDKDGGRATELARLRRSRSILDRYAAALVDRWDAADRADKAAR
jgi:hypothetical protein